MNDSSLWRDSDLHHNPTSRDGDPNTSRGHVECSTDYHRTKCTRSTGEPLMRYRCRHHGHHHNRVVVGLRVEACTYVSVGINIITKPSYWIWVLRVLIVQNSHVMTYWYDYSSCTVASTIEILQHHEEMSCRLSTNLLVEHVIPYLPRRKEWNEILLTHKNIYSLFVTQGRHTGEQDQEQEREQRDNGDSNSIPSSPFRPSPPWPHNVTTLDVGQCSLQECCILDSLYSPPSIKTMNVSSNGQWLACGCHDGTIRVINNITGKCTIIPSEAHHCMDIYQVLFVPNHSSILLSSGWDGRLRMWNVQHDCIRSLPCRWIKQQQPPIVDTTSTPGGNVIDCSSCSNNNVDWHGSHRMAFTDCGTKLISASRRYDTVDEQTQCYANITIWSFSIVSPHSSNLHTVSSSFTTSINVICHCLHHWGVPSGNAYFRAVAPVCSATNKNIPNNAALLDTKPKTPTTISCTYLATSRNREPRVTIWDLISLDSDNGHNDESTTTRPRIAAILDGHLLDIVGIVAIRNSNSIKESTHNDGDDGQHHESNNHLLVTASLDGTIRFWTIPNGTCLHVLGTPSPSTSASTSIYSFVGYVDTCNNKDQVRSDNDGTLRLAVGYYSGTTRVWSCHYRRNKVGTNDTNDRAAIPSPTISSTTTMKNDTNSEFQFTVDEIPVDRTARVCDEMNDGPVWSLAFVPKGQMLISGRRSNKSLRISNLWC